MSSDTINRQKTNGIPARGGPETLECNQKLQRNSMLSFVSIVTANFVSRVLALLLAAFLSFRVLSRWADLVACFACGLLLSIACTHLLPEAAHMGLDIHTVGYVLLIAIVVFVMIDRVLETFAGHSHGLPEAKPIPALLGGGTRYTVCEHGGGNARALPILIGVGCHNFVDGALIATAFMTDPLTGMLVTSAIFAHEVPQIMGQLVILTQTGLSRQTAVRYCLLAAMTAVLGGICGWMLFSMVEEFIPYAMIISAASFIFVVLSVLLPEFMNERKSGTGMIKQISAILLGVLVSVVILSPLHEHAHHGGETAHTPAVQMDTH